MRKAAFLGKRICRQLSNFYKKLFRHRMSWSLLTPHTYEEPHINKYLIVQSQQSKWCKSQKSMYVIWSSSTNRKRTLMAYRTLLKCVLLNSQNKNKSGVLKKSIKCRFAKRIGFESKWYLHKGKRVFIKASSWIISSSISLGCWRYERIRQ